ncbi:MAG: SGNH/GDSL hydrolase family protein [Cytophagaceae bacterium]
MKFFRTTLQAFLAISILLALISSVTKEEQNLIKPSDPNIQYTGRIDFSDKDKPSFSYPGISIKARFEGNNIEVFLQEHGQGGDRGTNYFNVTIDGKVHSVLQLSSNKKNYKIENLSEGIHTIELFKRTEAEVGPCSFLGFVLPSGKALLKPEEKPARKIEFIGDSFTCGYGNELSIAAPPAGNPNTGFNSKNENNYNAWGAITCRTLNAQYHCTAYSGRGLYRNNTGSKENVMPDIYDRIFPDKSSPEWKTENFIPDVVVINLGTNDFYPESLPNPDKVDSAAFAKKYISFIGKLRKHYPEATIVCVVPNAISDWWPEKAMWLTRFKRYLSSVVDNVNNAGDKKVFYFQLTPQSPPYGEDWHASIPTHEKMAKEITPFIREKMKWSE